MNKLNKFFMISTFFIFQTYTYAMNPPKEDFRQGGPPKKSPTLGPKVAIGEKDEVKIDASGKPYVGEPLNDQSRLFQSALNLCMSDGVVYDLETTSNYYLMLKNDLISYLAPQYPVEKDNFQYAIFGSQGYLKKMVEKIKLIQEDSFTYRIQCNFGVVSYLAIKETVANDSWSYAVFATQEFLDKNKKYYSSNFCIVEDKNKNNRVRSKFGEISYLTSKEKIANDSWDYAIFASQSHIDAIKLQSFIELQKVYCK